jgi:hypothetical protein
MLFTALLSTAVAYQRRERNVQYLSIMENTKKKKKKNIEFSTDGTIKEQELTLLWSPEMALSLPMPIYSCHRK